MTVVPGRGGPAHPGRAGRHSPAASARRVVLFACGRGLAPAGLPGHGGAGHSGGHAPVPARRVTRRHDHGHRQDGDQARAGPSAGGLGVPTAGPDHLPGGETVMAGPQAVLPGVAGEASRRASVFPVAVLLLLLATRTSDVLSAGHSGQVPFTVALFVLPLLYAIPGT